MQSTPESTDLALLPRDSPLANASIRDMSFASMFGSANVVVILTLLSLLSVPYHTTTLLVSMGPYRTLLATHGMRNLAIDVSVGVLLRMLLEVHGRFGIIRKCVFPEYESRDRRRARVRGAGVSHGLTGGTGGVHKEK